VQFFVIAFSLSNQVLSQDVQVNTI